MYQSSARFKSTLLEDHVVIAKAQIFTGDYKIADLLVDTGKVSVSASSLTRRTAEVHLTTNRTTANLVPNTGFDQLSPFGNEMKLYRGLQYNDGTTEYVPLGVFRITEVTIKDTNEGVSMSIKGEDRALIVSRNKWTGPYQMLSGTLETSIKALLQDRYADIQTNFVSTNVTVQQVTLGTNSSNDPWQDAVNICNMVGYDLYFDVLGVCQLKQLPDLASATVVAEYIEGVSTILTELDRTISSKETYNGVIYTLEGTQVTTPVRVEVWDEDTTSPTYRYGSFGQAPTFVTSSLLATAADATLAAQLLLNTYIGAQEQIQWNSFVDPTLDVQDVVYIKTIGSKVNRTIIIDALDVPLEPTGTLVAKGRTVRVINASSEVVLAGNI
jgi:hypothetical protein